MTDPETILPPKPKTWLGAAQPYVDRFWAAVEAHPDRALLVLSHLAAFGLGVWAGW